MWHNYENFEKSHGKYKLIIDFSLICCDIWGTKIQKCMSGKCSHTILFRWSQFHWGFAYILKIILQLFDNFQTTLGPQPTQNECKIMKEECTGWEWLFPRSIQCVFSYFVFFDFCSIQYHYLAPVVLRHHHMVLCWLAFWSFLSFSAVCSPAALSQSSLFSPLGNSSGLKCGANHHLDSSVSSLSSELFILWYII